MIAIDCPYGFFFDLDGKPLTGGKLYFGQAGLDPQENPVPTYFDAAGAVPAGPYVSTNNGYPVRAGSPTLIYTPGVYSLRVVNRKGVSVFYLEDSSSLPASIAVALADNTTPLQGAGMIGFDSTLPYPAGTLGAYIREIDVNVFNFIPAEHHPAILAGTSTVDVASYITQALNFAIARAPARVIFPTGKYRCNTVIGQFTGSNITIEGNGATIDAAGVQTLALDHFLQFAGTYSGTPATVTSDATASQKTVACNSAGFAVGDMVRVYSEAIWDSTRTNTKYGELNWVETIPDGASVTLVNELASTYATADTAKIEKVFACENNVIRNLTLIGPGPNDILMGQRHTLCVNLLIDNVKSFDWDITHLKLIDCAFGKIRNSHFEESNASATGYGTSFTDASQDCSVIGCDFTNVRHSLSTNNTTVGGYGVTRRIKFIANQVTDSAKTLGGAGGDAIDTHAGCEDIEIIDNTVFSSSGGGINAEGRSVTIRGNQIFHSTGNGITWQNYTDLAGEGTISDNRVRGVSGNYGIAITTQGALIRGLALNGNNVKINGRPYQITGTASMPIEADSFTGNVGVTGATQSAFIAEYCNHIGMSGGSMQSTAVGMQFENCSYCAVNGVAVEITGSGATGYGIRFQGTGEGNTVCGCAIVHSGTVVSSVGVSFINATITNSIIGSGNTAKDFTTGFNEGSGTGNVLSADVIDY